MPFDGRRDADQRLQQRRLAGAVAAEQRDDLVLVQREADIVEDVALAVEGVDVVERQQRVDARRRSRAACAATARRAGADIDLLHLGAGARVLDRAVEQHPAFVHDRDVVGELEHPVDVVLDQQHRQVGRDALDDGADALALGRGEPGERLVEQQHARRGGERQRPCRAGAGRHRTAMPASAFSMPARPR